MSKRKYNPQSATEPKGDAMSAPATCPAPAIGQAQGEAPAAVDAPGQAQGETPAPPLAAIDPAKGAAPRHPRPRLAPSLATVADVAALLACSPKKVYAMNRAGQLPLPLYLPSRGTGKAPRPRWPLAELRSWVQAGMPPREKWERMKKDF